MLISRKYHFIFIHIYKNAGTSITNALWPYCTNRYQKMANIVLKKLGLTYLDPQPYEGHITSADLISRMGKNNFDSYFSFAFVRNPWDWQVSLYKFMLKTPDHFQHDQVEKFCDFTEYIHWRCENDVHYQKDFVFSKDGEQLVDFLGRYEQVDNDFQSICNRIGISARLPKLNVSQTGSFRSYYTPETIELVRQTFEPDVKLFGYNF